MHAEATSAYWLRAPPWGALCRIDDTGATFSIVRIRGFAIWRRVPGEQCKRWHLARRSETVEENGWHYPRRGEKR